ncbi:myosin-11-like [Mya arenaria]|uniref:myosin-11-like n=1 Tax=Mya arenaria TaxID=6604 RepID=UPI0022E862CF|nr:myosin-11-like [Mya arenaria]
MKNIEVKMAEQKRKFEQMLDGKDTQIEESQEMLNTMEGQVIAFQQIVTQKDNYISELKKENSELLSKLKRSEQNLRDTNKELSDVRDIKNDAEAKTKQRNNQIHQLHMKQKELVSTLEQTESERKNVFDDLLIAKKQLHDTEVKLFEVREQKRDTEGKMHDALLRWVRWCRTFILTKIQTSSTSATNTDQRSWRRCSVSFMTTSGQPLTRSWKTSSFKIDT